MAAETAAGASLEEAEDNTDTSLPQSYVSPGSSEHNEEQEATISSPEQPIRGTINISRQNSSDSDIVPSAAPAHQFVPYSPNIYDSDGSDGSIVFNYPGNPPLTPQQSSDQLQQQPKRDDRDRFPSFDSMASTGSFRVIGSSSSQASPGGYRVSPSQPPQPTPVGLLPYAQRRKLQQEREEQQREQQPQQPQRPMQQIPMYTPMPPNLYGPPGQPQQVQPYPPMDQYGGMPYMVPGPNGGMQMVPPMPPQMMGLPPPPMNFVPPPQQQPNQPLARPPSSGRRTPPPGPRTATSTSSKSRQPSDAATTKRKPQLHHSLPPSGPARGRTSSTDSLEPARPQRREGPLPPPPPPPPLNQYHVRADSSGSISSIGSSGSRGQGGMTALTDRLGNDIAGYLQEETPVPNQQQQQDGGGFMSFWSLSPRSRQKQQQSGMSVEEFHRRNQQFLQSSEQERQRMQKAMRDNSPHRQRQMPPSPRSHRPGLSSIDDDNWEEDSPDAVPASHSGRTMKYSHPAYDQSIQQQYSFDPYQVHYGRENVARAPPPDRHIGKSRSARSGDSSSESIMSSSFDESDDAASSQGHEANERTSLLPPSGISTGEHREMKESYTDGSSGRDRRSRKSKSRRPSRRETERWDNTHGGRAGRNDLLHDDRYNYYHQANEAGGWGDTGRQSKSKKKDRRRSRRHRYPQDYDEDVDLYRSSSSSSYQTSSRRQMRILEKERNRLIAQWKAEALAEAEADRRYNEANRWDRKLSECLATTLAPVHANWMNGWVKVETFISNLPLTLGAVALSIVTLGVVWFKFAEENLDSCQPVHFHSSQCTFPEFPGCFYCDKTATMYKFALNFHFACSILAGILAVLFFTKVFIARRVVLDEMSSPTTASPAGLICMTMVCVFAGRGALGQFVVSICAALHLCLAIWFIYMALAFHIMPEPSWFPNTVGIGMSAVKTWLYYPMPGHLLMAVSLSLNFFFFPVSLVRVPLNKKMSAPATWIQMSAPAVSLYALTIMAQPSFIEEHPDITHFQRVHRMVYLPCMHVLFALAIVGMISSIQSFVVRWDSFKTKRFSPAHAAFCFPTLAHANAVQAYRAAVNTFSDMPPKTPFKIALYTYWVAVLVSGTIATVYITAKFFYHLPGWTQIDVADEDEPPPPNETALTLQHVVTTGETLSQPFVSPAVLQANETGALVMLPNRGPDGRRRYRRTRRLTALGFEPIMNIIEMDHELEVLLEYVAKNPPRRRTQTLSVPGIDFNYGFGDFGEGNTGVYDDRRHSRSSTESNFGRQRSNTFGGSYYGSSGRSSG